MVEHLGPIIAKRIITDRAESREFEDKRGAQ